MSGVRFVRFYATDWRSGCIGLTPEEEGVYMRVCAHYWETGVRLTSNDTASASRIMLDVRMWKRIKAKLIQKGKLHVSHDGSIYNPRAEFEFERASGREEKPVLTTDVGAARRPDDRQHADGGSSVQGREPSGQVVLATSRGLHAEVAAKSTGSRGEVSENFAKKTNEINGPFREPEKSHSKKESPPTPKTFDGYERVRVVDGRLELFNGLKAFWLEKFGNDQARLDLALIEALPNLNTNSRTPLEAQVGRLLARVAGDKLDRDRRYAAAAAAKANAKPASVQHIVSPDTIRYAKPAPDMIHATAGKGGRHA